MSLFQEDIEAQKKEWELERLKCRQEEEERRMIEASLSDGEDILTMSRETAMNKVNNRRESSRNISPKKRQDTKIQTKTRNHNNSKIPVKQTSTPAAATNNCRSGLQEERVIPTRVSPRKSAPVVARKVLTPVVAAATTAPTPTRVSARVSRSPRKNYFEH